MLRSYGLGASGFAASSRSLLAALLILWAALLLGACAPRLAAPGEQAIDPRLDLENPAGPRFVTSDGLELPLRVWQPEAAEVLTANNDPGGSSVRDHPKDANRDPELACLVAPSALRLTGSDNCYPNASMASASEEPTELKAVVLALHGFNDYSKAFEGAGRYWSTYGVVTYAYDQRGFGASPQRGLWAGTETLARDLTEAAFLLRARHPTLPLYLLGESMGGAVILVAMASANPPPADGVILAAPAVWARDSMPWYQQAALWLASHTIPWASFTGEGLGVQASDNIEMLRALSRDPLFIKDTRVDAVHGLVDLMDAAMEAGPALRVPALLLYGEKDEIVPAEPSFQLWQSLPGDLRSIQRRALYSNGWHLLLRDLSAKVVLADVVGWMQAPDSPLLSQADLYAAEALTKTAETAAADLD